MRTTATGAASRQTLGADAAVTGEATAPTPLRSVIRRRPSLLPALVAIALALGACGDDSATPDEPAGESDHDGHGSSDVAEGARELRVTATSFEFDPEEITVRAGEDIAIVLTSDDVEHDFTIDELDAHVAADEDETATGGLRADEAGTYAYYCSVPGHRAAGMEGTLTVEAG